MQVKQFKEKDGIGIWMEGAGRHPMLSPDQIHELSSRIQALGEDDPERNRLVNKLVVHNLRLVVFSVKGYLSGGPSGRSWGCPETVDFLQVGAIGLKRAAEMYDPSRGYTFTTYANYWIRSKVTRYGIKTRSLVHVSESMSRSIISYKKNGFIKCRKTGRVLSDEKVRPMLEEAAAALSCISLNLKNEEGNELIASIGDTSVDGFDQDLPEDINDALVDAGVGALGREILLLRFGHGRSQRDIAKELGVTPRTVRRHMLLALEAARGSEKLAALV